MWHPEQEVRDTLILFGKEESLNRFLPSHEVAFQELSDTQVVVNDFFRWPLLRVKVSISISLKDFAVSVLAQ